MTRREKLGLLKSSAKAMILGATLGVWVYVVVWGEQPIVVVSWVSTYSTH